MNSAIYSPLDSSRREIRLLRFVEPNSDYLQPWEADPLTFSLETSSLETVQRYTAISYTWGGGDKTVPITLNGHTISITRSLEALLRGRLKRIRLLRAWNDPGFDRHCEESSDNDLQMIHKFRAIEARRNQSMIVQLKQHEARAYIDPLFDVELGTVEMPIFWIDQLCIDQESIRDRSEQVTLMGEIYARASTVEVHLDRDLDQPDDSAGAVFSLLNNLDNLLSQSPQSLFYHARVPLLMLGKLANCSWFERIWVVQELTLAKRTSVHLGTFGATWARIQHNAKLLPILREYLNDVRLDYQGDDYQTRYMHMMLEDIINTTEKLELNIIRFQVYQGLFHTDRGQLWDFLYETQTMKATDPRDKVYALLALAGDTRRTKFQVDYSEDWTVVYKKLVKWFVDQNGSLDILRLCAFEECPQLPSWTPYLQRQHMVAPLSVQSDGTPYKASDGYQLDVQFSPDLCSFSCHGVRIAAIAGVADLACTSDVIEEMQAELNAMQDNTTSGNRYRGPLAFAEDGTVHTRRSPRTKRMSTLSDNPWGNQILLMDKYKDLPDPYAPESRLDIAWRVLIGDHLLEDELSQERPYASRKDLEETMSQDWYKNIMGQPSGSGLFRHNPNVTDDDRREYKKIQDGVEESWENFKAHHKAISCISPAPLWLRDGYEVLTATTMLFDETTDKERAKKYSDALVSFLSGLCKRVMGRRSCITVNGHLGLAPSAARSGDLICVLYGASTPYVLRPCKEPNQFQLVGEAYVHGWMDGSALELALQSGHKPERFSLV